MNLTLYQIRMRLVLLKKKHQTVQLIQLYCASITVLLSYYDSIVDDWMLSDQQVHFTAGFEVL